MTSKTQIFESARVRTCDASLSAGKQRNDTGTQAFHRLVNRTNVYFRYNSQLISDADSATSSGSTSSDRLNWDMLGIWVFVCSISLRSYSPDTSFGPMRQPITLLSKGSGAKR